MKRPDFIVSDAGVIPIARIAYIDTQQIEKGFIDVHHDKGIDRITGFFALEALMIVKPSALEGKRLRWHKRAWFIHNVFAHPAMQFLAIAAQLTRPVSEQASRRLYKTAMQIHDNTVPVPVDFRTQSVSKTAPEV